MFSDLKSEIPKMDNRSLRIVMDDSLEGWIDEGFYSTFLAELDSPENGGETSCLLTPSFAILFSSIVLTGKHMRYSSSVSAKARRREDGVMHARTVIIAIYAL